MKKILMVVALLGLGFMVGCGEEGGGSAKKPTPSSSAKPTTSMSTPAPSGSAAK